jgi:hypothetical protein
LPGLLLDPGGPNPPLGELAHNLKEARTG